MYYGIMPQLWNMVQPSALVSHRGYRDMMFMLVLALVAIDSGVQSCTSSTSTRYHLALSYMYGVFGVSSAGLAVWLVTGRVAGLSVALLVVALADRGAQCVAYRGQCAAVGHLREAGLDRTRQVRHDGNRRPVYDSWPLAMACHVA